MNILFFGGYNQDYARNKVIKHGLEKNGVRVEECHSQKGFLLRFFTLLFRGFFKSFDVLWVPYPGHTDILCGKILCVLKRKPLVFDVFVSRWDSEVEYGNILGKKSFKAKFLWWSDKIACELADLVFLDTPQHIDFFVKEFGILRKKLEWVFIGANEKVFYPQKQSKKGKKFNALYYGLAAPLHGLEHIISAAQLLKDDREIKVTLVGGNWRYRDAMEKQASEQVFDFKGLLPLEKIPAEIAKADVVFGLFGDTPKAQRVIPNKVFEAIAMKKPVITMRSSAVSMVFEHKKNVFLVDAASPRQIAKAVLELKKNRRLREKIAETGHNLFEESFSEAVIGKKILRVLQKLV